MIDFAPGMRTIIRDEEWMVKKIETNSLGNKTLYCVGISPLVKDREAIFLTDLEEIQIVDPAEVKLVADTSPFYKRALLYLESQWRQQIPTDANLHIGHNKRIKGDMRIIEILITKEEQALKNIGDPSLLLGKFTIEDEELVVAETIESGSDSDAFEQTLDAGEDDFDPFEALMAAAGKEEDEDEKKSEIVSDETLFSDMDYLYQALTYLNQTENHPVERLKTVSGLDIRLTPDMERRLKALVPEEALPQGETLRVSDDKAFCMEQMRSSMQKNMDESAWPTTQYLWKLHPVLSWVNDKASLLFKRDEAPVLGIPGALKAGESIYVVTGSMPNLKSTPLVDEWFGLLYQDGKFVKVLSMNEVVQKTGLSDSQIPNTNCIGEDEISAASFLLRDVVSQAKRYLDEHYKRYQTEMSPLLDEEVDKLIELQEKHKEYYQMTLFEHERKLKEQERRVDELFDQFMSWVKETLTIQNNPYIRVVGNEVLYDMKTRLGRDLDAEPVDAGQLTLECLRYMYRMLFVLFIESRPELGYAPIKAQSYYSGYSLESLRDIADNIRDDVNEVGDGYYLHETLAKLYELIYDGYPKTEDELKKATGSDSLHDMFLIAPLKAHIFDPEYTKMITAAKLRNSCMLRIIDLMSLTRATGRKNGRRGRISYVNLGINQMGAVYEALLSYRGFIAEHDLYEVKRAGDSFNELDVGYFVSESELEQYTEDERVRYESGEKAGKLRMYEKGTFIVN